MFFGTGHREEPRRGIPRSLRRQLMLQVVIFFMVTGLIIVLFLQARSGEKELARSIPAAGEAVEAPPFPEGLREELGGELEVPENVLPEPFEERPEVVAEAAVLEAKGEIATDAIVYYFQKARNREEELESGEPVLSTRGGGKVWEELVRQPNRYRGKLVEIRGNIVLPAGAAAAVDLDREITLPWPNPAGVAKIYRAFVYDGRRFFLVSTLTREGADLSSMDPVSFRGYFAQLYSYDVELRDKKGTAKIPLLVGEKLTPLPPVLTRGPDLLPLYTIAVLLPLVAGGVIIALSLRSRRSSRATRSTFPMHRRKDDRAS